MKQTLAMDESFVFLLPAAIFALPAVIMAHNVYEVRRWRRVPGEIVSTRLVHMRYPSSAARSYRPAVRYRYTVDGVEHEGNVLFHGMESGGSKPWAQRIADRYPPGARVTVMHHPVLPEKACLDAEFGFFGWVLAALASVFTLLAVAC